MKMNSSSVRSGICRPDGAGEICGVGGYKDFAPDGALKRDGHGLWDHFPPVYLKADKKGRHRYGQAIHRADRGNIKTLATLIALSIIEIYEKLLNAFKSE
jgi:hypothetical protein